jgi:hypothetical protein
MPLEWRGHDPGQAMDIVDLSLKMKRLVQWLDSQRPPDRFIRKRFDGPPFGNCYVTIDPDRQARFASGNMNRVYLCGAEPGMDSDSIRHIIDLFAAEGIGRFFVWLSPGPGMDAVRGWLEASGLTRVQWTGYPTLCRSIRSPVPFSTDLEVREVGADEIAAMREPPDQTIWPDYLRPAGSEGFFHYMAFDVRRPVAIAALCIFEDIGYLMAGATAESHRRRGGAAGADRDADRTRRSARLRDRSIRDPVYARTLLAESATRRLPGSVRERSL